MGRDPIYFRAFALAFPAFGLTWLPAGFAESGLAESGVAEPGAA